MTAGRGILLYVAGGATGFALAMLLDLSPDGRRAGTRSREFAERAPPREAERARETEPLPLPPGPPAPSPGGRPADAPPAPGAGADATEAPPAPGTRLPDGRIVGGATWNRTFVQSAVGMLDNFFQKFLDEAQLTPEQAQRLKAEMDASTRQAMQLLADFINGDVPPDGAYDAFSKMASVGRETLRRELDDTQFELYRKFETEVTGYFETQIVSNEVATLREELRLDPEQEKAVSSIVRERYARVQSALPHVIPNFMFRPIRRGQDAPVYEETARRISEVLRPEQQDPFRRIEEDPHRPLQLARPYLVPK